jgi:hypothetical protein
VSGQDIERSGFGPFETLPTFFNTTTLGTTPVKVTLPTPPIMAGNAATPPTIGNIRVKIVNPSTTATIAWSIVKLTNPATAAPSITADYAATGGSAIPPGGVEYFVIPAARELYVVASASSTSCHVTSFLYR